MVPRVANAHSLSLRPLIQDDIEALRMVEKMARTRYRALGGFFAQAAEAPAIAAERFVGGETIVAELHFAPVGFLVLRPLDELLQHRARQLKVAGLSLTTFRTPPWNGPWFHRQGYSLIPLERIGPGLRAILDRHATVHDMATRETLWKPIGTTAKADDADGS
jgi:hypothetical protein